MISGNCNVRNKDKEVSTDSNFVKFCEDTYNDLKTKIYTKTGNNKYMTDEIIQTTYELATINREKLLAHPNPRGWLGKTAINTYYNIRNKDKNTARNEIKYADIRDFSFPLYSFYDEEYNEYQKYQKNVETKITGITSIWIREFTASLTKKEKELLKYKVDGNLSLKEIAKKQNASYDSVRKLNYRLLKKANKIKSTFVV